MRGGGNHGRWNTYDSPTAESAVGVLVTRLGLKAKEQQASRQRRETYGYARGKAGWIRPGLIGAIASTDKVIGAFRDYVATPVEDHNMDVLISTLLTKLKGDRNGQL